jgi:lipopolysaccharide/colanic/teichoic acid biosynthesis glycosyltransferase
MEGTVTTLTDTARANQHSKLKRIIDYALCIPLIILLLPVMGVLALLIKLISPGPALFIQDREGMSGRTFQFYKFRTMYVDADTRLADFFKQHAEREVEWRHFFKLDSDPRIIPWIGTYLRKSSLDELPNLFNILKGDMSLVGPRPFPLYHTQTFDPTFRALRNTVWPGLTGLWQVERGGIDVQMALDTHYVQNWSCSLDFKILVRTIPVLLFSKKAHF